MCSVVDATLSTFDDTVLNTTELAKDNCWTLIAADCSDQSLLSLFIKLNADGSVAIKVYVGDDTIEYDPQENVEQIMTVNGEKKFKLNAMDVKEISSLSNLTPIKWVYIRITLKFHLYRLTSDVIFDVVVLVLE